MGTYRYDIEGTKGYYERDYEDWKKWADNCQGKSDYGMHKLKELMSIRRRGLISKSEYNMKRNIMEKEYLGL